MKFVCFRINKKMKVCSAISYFFFRRKTSKFIILPKLLLNNNIFFLFILLHVNCLNVVFYVKFSCKQSNKQIIQLHDVKLNV